MIDWLKKHHWVQESNSGFSETVSFLAFLVMPGCVFGALIERLFFNGD